MKTLIKDALREIKSNFSRFFAIFALLFISMFAFTGLFRTVYLLREVPEEFYNNTNMHDVTVVSTLGLTSKDETIIGSNVDVDTYEMEYDLDVFLDGTDDTIRLQSLTNDISRPLVMKGRVPDKKDEIALDYDFFKEKVKIGDKVKFNDENIDENLDLTEYIVVGFVRSPDHLSENITQMSTNGSGYIDSFGFILKDNFNLDYYTKAKIRGGNPFLHNQDSDYPLYVDNLVDSLDKSFEGRAKERLAEVKSEGQEKISESEGKITVAKTELEDAKTKLSDAESELKDGKIEVSDAEKKIKDAEKTLASSKERLDNGWSDYRRGLKDLEEKEKTARAEIADAEEKLAASRAKLDKNRVEIENGLAEIEKNRPEIEAGKLKLDEAESELNNKQKEIDASRSELIAKKEELKKAEENISYPSTEEEMQGLSSDEINKLKTEISMSEKRLDEAQKSIDIAREDINKNLSEFNEKSRSFYENEKSLNEAKAKLEEGQSEYDSGINELNNNKIKLEEELKEGRRKLESAKSELEDGERSYNNGMSELRNSKKRLAQAREDLKKGQEEYQEGLEKYNKESKDAEKKISEGEDELKDAKDYLLKLEEPSLLIESRYTDTSYQTISDFPSGLNVLSYVFSFLCLLVSLLLSLTTLTRMVDERRSIIGTYKGLGYNNRQIATKFLLFGGISGFLGAILGIILGQDILSRIIFEIYMGNFILDGKSEYFSTILLVIGFFMTVITTLLSSYLAVKSLLKEKTADLLRPKPPAEGSRIFLENTAIWYKLNFFQKVTARNIFRYKGRMFMTIFGVAICMSIMILGIGMKFAIENMTKSQFEDVQKYDYMVFIDEENSDDSKNFLDKNKDIEIIAPVNNRRIKLKSKDNMTQNVSLVIKTDENLDKLVGLRDYESLEDLEISDDGVLITKKLSDLTGKNKGSTINVLVNGKDVELKVEGVVENYIDHYIYTSDKYFEKSADLDIKTNSFIIKLNEDNFNRESFEKSLNDNEDILGYVGTYDLIDQADRLIDTLNIIIIIIIAISMLLSIVVLYNLTNINISERKRELSTMKVLGFYPKEVTGYIFRETFILTAIGILVGLIIGNLILNYVLTSFAPSIMLFGSSNKPITFSISSIFIIIFSIIVMIIMHKKLRHIDPLEALKAVE